MGIQNGLQVILQTKRDDGSFDCEGFIGLPILDPCQVVLASDDTVQAHGWADQLRQGLTNEILSLTDDAHGCGVPCQGLISNPVGCHAREEPSCQRLMVYFIDDTTPPDLPSEVDLWHQSGLPIIPVIRSTADLGNALPVELSRRNVMHWGGAPGEIVPTILAQSGLTAEEFKIFISYRQDDATALANQLFHALSEQKFDVFLDRFSGSPGQDFVVQLTEALAEMSFLLVLESSDIRQSSWTTYEINFAKSHELGLLALTMPGGDRLTDLMGNDRRHAPGKSAFTSTGTDAELQDAPLSELVNRVKQEHGRSFVSRRRYLRDTMRDALLSEGVLNQSYQAGGVLRVDRGINAPYSIFLSPRPAGLVEFHRTAIGRDGAGLGIVIGPQQFLVNIRQARRAWLSDVSGLRLFDESEIQSVARNISSGAL